MDYTQGIYKYRDTSIKIPYLDFNIDVTDINNWEYVQKKHHCSEEFLHWFRNNFSFLGALSPDDFTANILWMCEKLANIKYFIFINGAEFPVKNNQEIDRHIHHAKMNATLVRAIEHLGNASVCDIRPYLKTKDDFTDNIRHYQRQGYSLISGALDKIIERVNIIEN
jgi:hypothetical protein